MTARACRLPLLTKRQASRLGARHCPDGCCCVFSTPWRGVWIANLGRVWSVVIVQTERLQVTGVTFREPELQHRYEADGYVTFSYLSADQLNQLAGIGPRGDDDPGSFHWSAISSDL